MQAELKEGKLSIVRKMAEEQKEYGADILDINMGMNGIDEKEMMLKVIKEVTRIPTVVTSPSTIISSFSIPSEMALSTILWIISFFSFKDGKTRF